MGNDAAIEFPRQSRAKWPVKTMICPRNFIKINKKLSLFYANSTFILAIYVLTYCMNNIKLWKSENQPLHVGLLCNAVNFSSLDAVFFNHFTKNGMTFSGFTNHKSFLV